MKLCAVTLESPSIVPHPTCRFWTRSEYVNMPKTLESSTKCEVHAVIWFLYAEGCNATAIYVYGETFMSDSKVRQWCRNFEAECTDVQSSCITAALCHHSWNLHCTHYSFVDELNYSMHFTSGGRLYCFRHVYVLTTRSELTSAMWRDRRAY